MRQLQYPDSTRDQGRQSESCRVSTRNLLLPAYLGETEITTFGQPLKDLAVLSQIQSQAMAWLYERYADFIYSISLRILCNPAEAEDVLQEVLVRVWRSPEHLQVRKNLYPWMAVVSRNSSIDKIRKRRPSESVENISLASPCDTALQVEQNQLCEKARALIGQLPMRQRVALEMAYFDGMTHSEIADRTGSPLGTIKTRIRDGLKKLRRDLHPSGCPSS